MKKTFTLRDILTVTTGRLLTKRISETDNGIINLYIILEHMTGEPPFTHTLGRFSNECKPFLLKWFPELDNADVTELDKIKNTQDGWMEKWLTRCVTEWGMSTEYSVRQIPKKSHAIKNPISELAEMDYKVDSI